MSSIHEGTACHFNSHFNSFEKRPDYQNFSAVRAGDKGVAYDYSTGKQLVFLFDVTEALHLDESRQEIFSFVVTMKPSTGVAFSVFTQALPFDSKLDKESLEKLFKLTKDQYELLSGMIHSTGI